MKIIGKTEEGLLLSASEDEVANFLGVYSQYQHKGLPDLVPGTEIKIAEMYNQLYSLDRNREELGKIANKLRMIADLLQFNEPIMQKLVAKPEQQ